MSAVGVLERTSVIDDPLQRNQGSSETARRRGQFLAVLHAALINCSALMNVFLSRNDVLQKNKVAVSSERRVPP